MKTFNEWLQEEGLQDFIGKQYIGAAGGVLNAGKQALQLPFKVAGSVWKNRNEPVGKGLGNVGMDALKAAGDIPMENQTAADINAAFQGMTGAFHDMKGRKITEYAQRIINGEKPEIVLQGFNQNGAMWTSVMQKVQQLQGQNTFSVSTLENKLGIKNGSLSITPSKDKRYIFVRNRFNGQSISVNPNPQEIEAAAKKLFGLV